MHIAERLYVYTMYIYVYIANSAYIAKNLIISKNTLFFKTQNAKQSSNIIEAFYYAETILSSFSIFFTNDRSGGLIVFAILCCATRGAEMTPFHISGEYP